MSFAGLLPGHGSRAWACLRALAIALSLALLSVALVSSGPTQAAPTKGRKGKAKGGDSSLWIFRKAANVVPNQQGKIVVFAFRNDEGDTVSTQVGQLLEARGLEVVTGVRPVDRAEHYRDVATHLHLIGFVDGDVRGGDANAKVTVRLRSGYTGSPMASATFTESRSNLAREISDNLWKKLGAAISRACADADKPRKLSRNTLQINAGTPIETVPAARKK